MYKVLVGIKNSVLVNEIFSVDDFYYYDDAYIEKFLSLEEHQKSMTAIVDHIEDFFYKDENIKLYNFKTPQNIPTKNFLRQLCQNNLKRYFENVKTNNIILETYLTRLDYELAIIHQKGFDDYFLIVWDYVKYAKDNKIAVGPGRGSAAGSLVSFLLNITTVDPLDYDLLFERFLNPERKTMPDIDIDFQDDRREEVIEYIFEKYGKYNVAMISTFQTIGVKNALRDCGRTLGINISDINVICKFVPEDAKFDFAETLKNSKSLQIYKEQYATLFNYAEKIVGFPRQSGTHAAGIIISSIDIRKTMPLRSGINGINQTQFPMDFLEPLGFIKMDLLGLRNLRLIENIKENVLKSRNVEIDLNKINLNDPKVFDLLKKGYTNGIFQLESTGMTDVVKKIQVNSIEDISAASALYRPGPQEHIPEFAKRKAKGFFNDYIDPSLKDILKQTYGIPIYQEQVMQILQKVANISLAEADIVRRAISKKDFELMHNYKNSFIQKAIANNFDHNRAEKIWQWIENFANYGFNKSHSIAYSIIGYWLAYLKTHYSEEFFAKLLDSQIGNTQKLNQTASEARIFAIKIISPKIANIQGNFYGLAKKIFAPLNIVKGMTKNFLHELQNLYHKNKVYFNSFFKLMTHIIDFGLTKDLFLALIYAGAFSTYEFSKMTLINNVDKIILFAKTNSKLEEIDIFTIPELRVVSDVDDEIFLSEMEAESIGFYATQSLFLLIKRKISYKEKLVNISELVAGTIVSVLVKVVSVNMSQDKNSKEMAFMSVEDSTGSTRITIFADVLAKIANILKPNGIYIFKIKVQTYKGRISSHLIEIIETIRK